MNQFQKNILKRLQEYNIFNIISNVIYNLHYVCLKSFMVKFFACLVDFIILYDL